MLRASLALIGLVAAVVTDAPAQDLNSRLKTIAASKTVKLAYRSDATPFSFMNERRQVAGFTIDLCKEVVTSLERQLNIQGLTIQWVAVTTQSRFDAVATGKADLECGSSSVTLTRMKQVDFSNFVFIESTGVAVKSTSKIDSLKDLAGKKIAVIGGTTNERAMADTNRQSKLNATIVVVKDRDAAIAAFEDGRADAFASDKLLLVGAQFKDPQAVRILPDELSIEPYAIVLPRNDGALRLAVNTALAEIYRSGEILKIFDRWFAPLGLQPGPLLTSSYLLGALPE